MDWTLCLERSIGTGGLLNIWILRWKEWYIIKDWEISSLRRSAGTGIIAVLPGNHKEFVR